MKFRLNLLMLLGVACLISSCSSNLAEQEENDLATDGMEQAMRQEFIMTHDPNTNTIPSERLEAARAIANTLPATMTGLQGITWQERGPNAIGGRTRAILVDRRDNTGNTVLAGSVSGGIFRTTTFTGTPNWAPVADNMLNLAVTCMLQDKTNGAIMYAGTGEGWFNIDAVKGAGVFKSTDGGITWNLMPSTSGFEYVQDIEQDNNGYLYVSLRNLNTTNRGVMRSTDGGTTWTQVLGAPLAGFLTGRAADLEVASNGDIYATLGIFSKTVVLRSPGTNGTNTGAIGTWTDITPVHTASTERAEIAVAPSNPQRVYLAMVDSASSKVITFYRSSNAGSSWDSLVAPDAIINGSAAQAWYNLIVQVAPTNPDMVLIGGLNIARSTDAGTSWISLSTSSTVHPDQHQLVFAGSNDKLIVGNDGGLYYSTDATSVSPTFVTKNNNYNVTQLYAADIHPTDPNYFLAGAQDNNTLKFTAAGINPGTPVVGGDGGFCHIRQTDGALQIAAYVHNNYYRSTNGGANWSSLGTSVNNTRGQFINATDLDDAQNVLYCGDDAGKYYYVSGLDASPLGTQVTLAELGSNRIVTAVKVDPFATNTVWLGTSSTGVAVMPEIVKVTNANTTNPLASAFQLPSVAGASVSNIDIDPNTATHMLVTLSNYGINNIFETTDGGITWNAIDGNLPDMPVRWGMFVPGNASVNGTNAGGILIATELGVWYATGGNGGSTVWTQQSTGFPNVRTDMLRYRLSDRLVLAATHGRGIFTANLTAVSTGINPVTLTKNFIRYISATNDQLYIYTGSLNVQKVQMEILDMSGRLVYRSGGGYQNTSIYTGNLSKGAYVLRIFGDKNEYYAQQFMK